MIDEELRAIVQRVGLLQQSPKAALDAAQERLQQQLDQFRQRHPETQGPETP
jgi:hypothetical protein